MPKGSSIQLRGVKELQSAFKVLPKRVANRIKPKILRRGAKPFIKEMKKNLPTGEFIQAFGDRKGQSFEYKAIKKSLGIVIRGKKARKYAAFGPRMPEGWWASWIEYGTLAKRTRPLKRSRKAGAQKLADKGFGLKKRPFFRPALVSQRNAAFRIMLNETPREIVKELNKIVKRGKL